MNRTHIRACILVFYNTIVLFINSVLKKINLIA